MSILRKIWEWLKKGPRWLVLPAIFGGLAGLWRVFRRSPPAGGSPRVGISKDEARRAKTEATRKALAKIKTIQAQAEADKDRGREKYGDFE